MSRPTPTKSQLNALRREVFAGLRGYRDALEADRILRLKSNKVTCSLQTCRDGDDVLRFGIPHRVTDVVGGQRCLAVAEASVEFRVFAPDAQAGNNAVCKIMMVTADRFGGEERYANFHLTAARTVWETFDDGISMPCHPSDRLFEQHVARFGAKPLLRFGDVVPSLFFKGPNPA